MARIRNLRPGFFKDEHLAELPPLTRILFEGLWTLADRAGNLEDRPRFIKVEVLPYDDCDTDAMLHDLQQAGFIRRYMAGDDNLYIHIPCFLKHQRVSGDEAKAPLTIPPPDEPGKKLRKTRAEVSPKHVRSSDEADLKQVSGRSTEIGVLKSVALRADDARPTVVPFGADFGAMPTRRRNPALAWEGTREGLGVPDKLHRDLLSKMATPDEAALLAWYAETERAWSGLAIGDTVWKFWNARFAEWQGTTERHGKVAGLTGGGVSASAARVSVPVIDPDYRGHEHRFHCGHAPTCTTWPQCRDHETAVAS